MSIKKRCVGYYFLTVEDKNNKISVLELENILHYITGLNETDSMWIHKISNKAYRLKKFEISGNKRHLLFQTCKYNHRPNLLNIETAVERENPKNLSEGEAESTHIAIKQKDSENEYIMLIEERQVGISINIFSEYLNHFIKKYNEEKNVKYVLTYHIVPNEDFLSSLDEIVKYDVAKITYDKKITGTDYLDFANECEELKSNVQLIIKPEKGFQLKNTVTRLFSEKENSDLIRKISVEGISSTGNSIKIDTDFIKKREYIEVELCLETMTVKESDLFSNLDTILENL